MKSKTWLNLVPIIATVAVGFPIYQQWQRSQAPSQLDYENAAASVLSSRPTGTMPTSERSGGECGRWRYAYSDFSR